MSVVTLKRTSNEAVTGSGMDRVVASNKLSTRTKLIGGGGAVAALVAAFVAFAPLGNVQSVEASRVTISTVSKGVFEDYLPLRARVTPLITVYLDAVEGGRVEQVFVEDGAQVVKGQPLARLSNAELQLNVLARQTEVTQQINDMRTQELALQRNKLETERNLADADFQLSKMKRQLDRDGALVQQGWVPKKTYNDTRDEYAYQARRHKLAIDSQTTDDKLQTSQLRQMRASAIQLTQSLEVARSNLDSLNIRAPVTGSLSGFTIQIGQSMSRGERLGQVDSPGRNKLMAGVDEFYLGRVQLGQTATLDWNGKPYKMKVSKLYPTVKNGEFEVDLTFVGGEPAGVQRGQTLQAKLTLGDPAPAILIPNGAFYNDTGGAWVFVVTPDGGKAQKRNVRLGRRNANFIEVLDGLEPGEKVLTSPYTGLTDKDRLEIAKK